MYADDKLRFSYTELRGFLPAVYLHILPNIRLKCALLLTAPIVFGNLVNIFETAVLLHSERPFTIIFTAGHTLLLYANTGHGDFQIRGMSFIKKRLKPLRFQAFIMFQANPLLGDAANEVLDFRICHTA